MVRFRRSSALRGLGGISVVVAVVVVGDSTSILSSIHIGRAGFHVPKLLHLTMGDPLR